MAYAVRLSQFEGPLHLLLDLIEQKKMDVSDVALAAVTDSFLDHLEAADDLPTEELTDFLVVASKLLLIKSRLLLPYLQLHEEEEGGDLESQLKIYREYLEATKTVETMLGKRKFLYVHEKLPNVEVGFAPPKSLTSERMTALFEGVLKRLEPFLREATKAAVEKTVSIHEKILQIRDFLRTASRASFRSVLEGARSRTEVVVSFLALLELVKQRSVEVSQGGQFEDITITRADNAQA